MPPKIWDNIIMSNTILMMHVTFPVNVDAQHLCNKLLTKKLAACIQQSSPITSRYIWEGKTECSDEYTLIIKTTPDHCDAITQIILDTHPYDTPEILWFPATAHASYAEWVYESTR